MSKSNSELEAEVVAYNKWRGEIDERHPTLLAAFRAGMVHQSAALSAQQAAGEAVAWMYSREGYASIIKSEKLVIIPKSAVETPLYAAPKAQAGWQPIETMMLWDAGIVTDGDNVAMSQKAEADYGGHYFAVDPEDALEWEPTHWIAAPLTDGDNR